MKIAITTVLIRVLPALAIVGSILACSESPVAPTTVIALKMRHLEACNYETGYCPEDFTPDLAHDFGSYTVNGTTSTDTDVNNFQIAARDAELTAYDPISRDFSQPSNVVYWPAAVAAFRAGTVGVSAVAAAGRALAQTSQFRQAANQGARWALSVTTSVAAGMVIGQYPNASSPNSIPVADFDFMFDYASQ